MDKVMITEINKETFWQLIEEMKMECGQDMDASIEWMKQRLLQMPPEQLLWFHVLVHGYKDAANQYGLWSAARMVKEYGCTDDGFIDFRAWLIAQGKETYMAALAAPDSLTVISRYGDCEFETFSYVGDYAYEEQTGRSAYRDCTEAMRKKTLAGISGDPIPSADKVSAGSCGYGVCIPKDWGAVHRKEWHPGSPFRFGMEYLASGIKEAV